MNRLALRQLLVLIFILFMGISTGNAQIVKKRVPRNPEKSLFGGKSRKTKESKIREPRVVGKAKKAQAKKEEKLKKGYNNYVANSRKRAFKIQTPEVQKRMKENEKSISLREKHKKKRESTSTRKAGKKYK